MSITVNSDSGCLPLKAVNSLKLGKATGPDGISSEHLKYVIHLSLSFTCTNYFNELLRHGYVTEEFGHGIIIPPVNDRQGNTNNFDNYRAITVSSVISKVFELYVQGKFKGFLTSHSLQFGYKKGTSCKDAVFVVQQTVNYWYFVVVALYKIS